MFSHFKKFDWLLIIAVVVLVTLGTLSLLAVDLGNQNSTHYFIKQFSFFFLGMVLMLLISFLDTRIFKNYPSSLLIFYIIALFLLTAVLFFGQRVRGTTAWFRFGELSFEPVELVKLVIILVLAKYFSQRHIEVYRGRHIIISGLYVLLPAALVLRQPDLGSAIILFIIWLGIILFSGVKLKHLLIILLLGTLVAAIAWSFGLQPYQKERILTFLNPNKDPLGSSYNLIQAKIAIGSGGLWGRGLGHGPQSQLNFLPEKHTDFIFAALAEEWGLVGILFLNLIYILFFWRLTKISLACQSNFSRLFVAGFALMIFSQTFINIGMNLGLLPVVGIPLPFVSYGGSNLLTNFLALGIIQSVVVQTKNSSAVTIQNREEDI